MDKNIQDMLGSILGALPTNKQQEVQNCGSKDDFLGVLGSVKGLDIGSILGGAGDGKGGSDLLGGILGSVTGGKGDSNPIGGILGSVTGGKDGGSLIGQLGELLKGIDWADIQKFITSFFNKK